MTTEQKIRLLQTLVLNGLGDTTTRLHAARRPCLARFPHASPARVRDAGGSRRRKHIVPVEWRLAEAMRPLRCTVGRTSPETCASTLTGTPQYTASGRKDHGLAPRGTKSLLAVLSATSQTTKNAVTRSSSMP